MSKWPPYILVLLLCLPLGANAQNLVRNHALDHVLPTFDYHSNLGNSFPHWYDHTALNSVGNSASSSMHDSVCFMPNSLGCPGATIWGPNHYVLPLPREDRGYAGIGLLVPSRNVTPNYSGLGMAVNTLNSSLQKDTTYCTEIHVRILMNRHYGNWSGYTHDGLGLYFDANDSLPTHRPWLDGITPHVGGFGYITNDDYWRKLKGSFVANGDEQYMYIGNFDPFSTPLQPLPQTNAGTDTNLPLLFDAVYVYNCRDTLFSIMQQDTTVCYGQPVTLTPQVSGFKLQDTSTTYHWQTPSGSVITPDSTFVASEPGTYTVEVEINQRFKSSTTFNVHWIPQPPDTNMLQPRYTVCTGDNLPLTVPQIPKAQYAWSNGDTTYFTVIQQPGSHTLTVTTPCWQHNETFSVEEESCQVRLFVPNSFTPNGDGTNDLFIFHCTEQPVKLWVFDRWGKTVYQSNAYKNDWDGTYNGATLPTGAYTYLIEYNYTNPSATVADPEGSKRQQRGVINILP